MGFIKFIFIMILGYYLLKLIARLVAPSLFKYAARKTEEHFKQQFGQHGQPGNESQNIGEVTVDARGKKKDRGKEEIGEYIEFEEIE
ncbi:DUF4834 family protein [Zeaxanthinibacter enoshimensis]|uniref:Uncharacterized protein DUF4834 n=1 Tax=Zeaxanthinibacter enoshimensis TaxID=392009 RepID=A0A4R6TQ69_9FLAO|nr:DUF4834 family protein [Zeaxanthinibacter enoshimensis]TDQ31531.1 uncharacterized protein DUF4834 [Zeaxanthinibacter enoshimensis]